MESVEDDGSVEFSEHFPAQGMVGQDLGFTIERWRRSNSHHVNAPLELPIGCQQPESHRSSFPHPQLCNNGSFMTPDVDPSQRPHELMLPFDSQLMRTQQLQAQMSMMNGCTPHYLAEPMLSQSHNRPELQDNFINLQVNQQEVIPETLTTSDTDELSNLFASANDPMPSPGDQACSTSPEGYGQTDPNATGPLAINQSHTYDDSNRHGRYTGLHIPPNPTYNYEPDIAPSPSQISPTSEAPPYLSRRHAPQTVTYGAHYSSNHHPHPQAWAAEWANQRYAFGNYPAQSPQYGEHDSQGASHPQFFATTNNFQVAPIHDPRHSSSSNSDQRFSLQSSSFSTQASGASFSNQQQHSSMSSIGGNEPHLSAANRKRSSKEQVTDEETRRQTFLQRNREAAAKCRQKKKKEDTAAQSRRQMLEHHNKELHNEVEGLKAQLMSLKSAVISHHGQGCNKKEIRVATIGKHAREVLNHLMSDWTNTPELNSLRASLKGEAEKFKGGQGRPKGDGPSLLGQKKYMDIMLEREQAEREGREDADYDILEEDDLEEESDWDGDGGEEGDDEAE